MDGFKGKIRLVSIANSEGIQTFDLKKAPLSRETLEAIRSNDLIIHNAQLVTCASGGKPKRHSEMRAVGFDDTAILQITLIASWFNYINRVADALGIGREN